MICFLVSLVSQDRESVSVWMYTVRLEEYDTMHMQRTSAQRLLGILVELVLLSLYTARQPLFAFFFYTLEYLLSKHFVFPFFYLYFFTFFYL